MGILNGKHIVLGVTASVSAYKSCELARMFIKAGAKVRTVMSKNASHLVRPLLFETLTGNPVYIESFPEERIDPMKHIGLADWADIFVVAPATANFIGKAAGGIADDLISTTYLTINAPKVIAPAMNTRMWDDPSVQRNVALLKDQGVIFAGPGRGELACGTSGEGRLIELETIFDMAVKILTAPGVLTGIKILVTAGPTREYIDDVRFLSNPSTGKMGFAIAEEASKMGAEVLLIHGPVSIPQPKDVESLPIVSAGDMEREVIANASDADIIIMSAAVADWTVEKQSGKIKKSGRDKLTLEMKPTADILAKIGELFPTKLKVGFAVEVENVVENAREKMSRKKIDMIFANNPKTKGAAFGTDTNGGLLITHKETREIPILSKTEVARIIIAEAHRLLKEKRIDS